MNSRNKTGNKVWLYQNSIGQLVSSSSMVGDAVFSTLIKFIRLDTKSLQSYHEVIQWIKGKAAGTDLLEKFKARIWLDEESGQITELGLEQTPRYYYIIYVAKNIEILSQAEFNKQFKVIH